MADDIGQCTITLVGVPLSLLLNAVLGTAWYRQKHAREQRDGELQRLRARADARDRAARSSNS